MWVALVLVYEYHPTARTLQELHIHSQSHQHYKRSPYQAQHGGGLEERSLWSYIIQMACGIKAVHDAGLAVRTLAMGEGMDVWVVGKNR